MESPPRPDQPDTTESLDSFLPDITPYSTIEYWSPDYWNRRYLADLAHFEWYLPWRLFKSLIIPHFQARDAALDIGCGTSSLAASLVDEHFRHVVAIDVSEVVITHMKSRGSSDGALDFQVADWSALPFRKAEFDAVFDKGTLDSLAANPNSQKSILQCLTEAVRVLKPNGLYVLVSYGGPKSRGPLIPSALNHVSTTQLESNAEGMTTSCFVYVFRKSPSAFPLYD
jgi:ubiquinone/menaquinone biosynthesis C-methylase UbiE